MDVNNQTCVFIGAPTYDNEMHAKLSLRLMEEQRREDAPTFTLATKAVSLLAYNCNWLWCQALNNRPTVTHFLLVHADVLPEAGFMAKLLATMTEQQASVVSVAIPLKGTDGLVSTALMPEIGLDPLKAGREWKRRRLTLRELYRLPATFDARTLANFWGMTASDPCLLANTGLMLADIRGTWAERTWFEVNDAIYRNDSGQFVPQVEPEDWYFSRRAALNGARVVVTRDIKALHAGRANFPNDSAWGELENDL